MLGFGSMGFFKTLQLSVTSPSSYNQLLKKPYSFSWKYLMKLHLLIAAGFCLLIAIPLIVFHPGTLVHYVVEAYPKDLEITYHKEGMISINKDLPYVVTMQQVAHDDPAVTQKKADDHAPTNFVVFDTEKDPAHATFAEYDTVVLITEHQVQFMQRENGTLEQSRTYTVPAGEKDLTVTYAKLSDLSQRFLSNVFISKKLYVPVLLILIYPLMFAGLMIARIVTLAFFTLFAWILTLIFMRGKSFTYAQLFRVSMHSITLILLLGYLSDVLHLYFFRGFVLFFAFLLWTMYILSFVEPISATHAHSEHHTHPKAVAHKKKPAAKKKASK